MTGLVLRVPIKYMGSAMGVVPFVDGSMVKKIAYIDNLQSEPRYEYIGKNDYYNFYRVNGKYNI